MLRSGWMDLLIAGPEITRRWRSPAPVTGSGQRWSRKLGTSGLSPLEFLFFINTGLYSTVCVFFFYKTLHFLGEMVEVQCTPLPFHTEGGQDLGVPCVKGVFQILISLPPAYPHNHRARVVGMRPLSPSTWGHPPHVEGMWPGAVQERGGAALCPPLFSAAGQVNVLG